MLNDDEWSVIATIVDANGLKTLTKLCKTSKIAADNEIKKRSLRLAAELGLTVEQGSVVESVVLRNSNVYLAGAAGSGKSFTTKKIVEHMFRNRKGILLSAPTGCAAQRVSVSRRHLCGSTLHSTFNIKNMKRDFRRRDGHCVDAVQLSAEEEAKYGDELENLNKPGYFPTAVLTSRHKQVLKRLDLLVIDEVSMVTPDMLEVVDYTLRWVKGKPRQLFGGVQLLFIGDFSQLTGIKVRTDRPDGAQFCFQMQLWKMLKEVVLTTVIRTKNKKHANFLDLARDAKLTYKDCDELHSKLAYQQARPAQLSLFPKNNDCDRINNERFRALPGRQYSFPGQRELVVVHSDPLSFFSVKKADALLCHKNLEFPFTPPVVLKVGCRVRATQNVYGKEEEEEEEEEDSRSVVYSGPIDAQVDTETPVDQVRVHETSLYAIDRPRRVVTAGTLGTVTRIAGGDVFVRWDEDESRRERRVPRAYKRKVQSFEYYSLHEDSQAQYPVTAVASMLPLAHGYAYTVHKAQGSTIHCRVDIDTLSWPGCYGSAYTALSRATDIAKVKFVRPPLPAHFETHPLVLEYNRKLFGNVQRLSGSKRERE